MLVWSSRTRGHSNVLLRTVTVDAAQPPREGTDGQVAGTVTARETEAANPPPADTTHQVRMRERATAHAGAHAYYYQDR